VSIRLAISRIIAYFQAPLKFNTPISVLQGIFLYFSRLSAIFFMSVSDHFQSNYSSCFSKKFSEFFSRKILTFTDLFSKKTCGPTALYSVGPQVFSFYVFTMTQKCARLS